MPTHRNAGNTNFFAACAQLLHQLIDFGSVLQHYREQQMMPGMASLFLKYFEQAILTRTVMRCIDSYGKEPRSS